jgi:hypothetical protein
MAITNGYCTLADVKSALRITDSVDDSLIEISIEAASREIDGYCQRTFFSQSATRVYNSTDSFTVETDDIISVTTLKTSDGGTVYDTTWKVSDYQLEPLNGYSGGLTQPYTRIRAVGDYLFPIWSVEGTYTNFASVQIVGVFGWSAIPTAVKQASILLAMRQFKRYDSPLGIAGGFGDMGAMRVGRVDPDVEALLMPFKKIIAT